MQLVPSVTSQRAQANGAADITFLAKQAFDCLISVPFDPVVGSRLIKYYTDTLQFQTTLSYLKTPPSTYQQPAVDLIGGLEKIQQQIDDGTFRNQYEFEATLKQLVYEAHDSHLQISLGILHAFSFYSPYYFISLSADGTQLPRLYIIGAIFSLGHDWRALLTIGRRYFGCSKQLLIYGVTDQIRQWPRCSRVRNAVWSEECNREPRTQCGLERFNVKLCGIYPRRL